MLHSVEFLCSVVVAFARLAHALMSLCSPRSALQVIAARIPPVRTIKMVRPVMAVAVTALLDDATDQLLAALPPPVLVLPAFKAGKINSAGGKATAKRPSKLLIPPPMARAGVNPFGEACSEAAVAAEVEAQGEGFCVASRRGVRHAMEDAYGVFTDEIAGGSQLAFYGVYDGHGGRAAVDLIADKLGKNIVAALAAAPSRQEGGVQLEPDVMAAIRAGYLTTDSDFLSQSARGGACAVTALVKDGELYVANVGDCRAVLGSRNGVATALTSDHTPGREDEQLRIESSGITQGHPNTHSHRTHRRIQGSTPNNLQLNTGKYNLQKRRPPHSGGKGQEQTRHGEALPRSRKGVLIGADTGLKTPEHQLVLMPKRDPSLL